MEKIRIAMVGCGKISTNHLKAIRECHDSLHLVGAADAHPPSLEKWAEEQKVPGFSSIKSLVENVRPTIVSLCTPSGLHAQQTMELADMGCHVITEKPMATRWEDAKAMIKACETANVRLFVVKQNRFLPTLQLLKNAIETQRFGRIYLVNLNVFWTRPQAYYDQAKWRGTWDLDGGAFMNQASHYVDLLDWLIGPVQSISAMMATLGRQVEVEDTGVLNIRWRSGAVGSMNVTMLTYPKNLEASMTILGEKGTVKISGNSLNEITHWEFADHQPQDTEILAANELATSSLGSGHIPYYRNVIDTLCGRSEAMVDGKEGLRSMELLTASYLSARDQQIVSLPLEI